MPTLGRSFECPVISGRVTVTTLLERKRMGLPAVRTFLSCSGMSICLKDAQDPVDLISTPELCPLRMSLE
jgi:hypothetical protein